MSIQTVDHFECGRWHGKAVELEALEENLTSDGGLCLFGQLDEKLGWTKQLAGLITDPRTDPLQSALSIVRQRVFGIVAGYEDQNDHDTLRSDPVFKLIAGREPDELDLASQPTISRLENCVTAGDLLQMEDWFIDRFVGSFASPPACITLDIDTLDDPTHGQQQLTFFHGHYQQYQYLIRLITCAETDMVVLPTLLFGDAPAKLGAVEQLQRVIERLRERFPDTPIHVRADSAFGGPAEYSTLESLPGVTYTIGMPLNPKIKRLSEEDLGAATAAHKETQQSQLRFRSLEDYQSKTWDTARTVVVKSEVTAYSSSQRAVISNCADAATDPLLTYRNYAMRGESENRNKELKCDLCIDRLSDHRYMANLFRVMMHCVAHNLVATLRHLVKAGEPSPEGASVQTDPVSGSTSSGLIAIVGELQPVSSGGDTAHTRLHDETDHTKRQRHNARHRRNCLGEAHPQTWRLLVIKVAARIVVSSRRVRVLLSASWPNIPYLRRAAHAIHAFIGL